MKTLPEVKEYLAENLIEPGQNVGCIYGCLRAHYSKPELAESEITIRTFPSKTMGVNPSIITIEDFFKWFKT